MKIKNLADNFKFFIFDFDGVIIDSVKIKNDNFYNFFLRYGIDKANEVLDYHLNNLGINRYIKFDYIFKNILKENIEVLEKKNLLNQFSEYSLNNLYKAKLIIGSYEFIKKLYEIGMKIFIISASPQNELDLLLSKAKLNNYIIESLGSPVDKYDNFKYLKEKYNLETNKSVYFGDSLSDYKFSKFFNLSFVSVGPYLQNMKIDNYLKINNFSEIN